MDPNSGINQDPLAGNGTTSATAFSPDIDMSAINAALVAHSNTPNIQNSFDVNDISLDNTPTSDADLERQLNDNPNMNLANSADSAPAANSIPSTPTDIPVQPPSTPTLDSAASLDSTTTPDLASELSSIPTPDSTPEPEPTPLPAQPAAPVVVATNPLAAELQKEIANSAEEVIAAEAPDMNTIPVESSVRRSTDLTSISELANSAGSDPAVSTAPDAVPPSGAMSAQMDPYANLAESKSKLPTYILIGLSILAVVSVSIAIIVSIG